MDFIKKKVFYLPAIAVLLLLGWLMFRGGKNGSDFSTAKVKRGPLVSEVTVSASVKDKEAVELAFEKSGRIRKINVEVGDKVWEGSILLSLENGIEVSALEDARAKLASKKAHYDDLKVGARPEEIHVKESQLLKVQSDLAADYASVQNIILDSFNKADNAVHRQADILFSNSRTANPQLNFNSGDQQAVLDAQTARSSIEMVLNDFKTLYQEPIVNDTETENALFQTKNYLLPINDFLIKTNRALNASLNLSDSTIATDKDALNTARTNINTAITNVTDQTQTIHTDKIKVQTSADELALAKIGATAEVLAGASADVQSAEANVKNAESVLAKTYIFSPLTGIVTKQNGKLGEIAPANTALVAVASGNYKVEALIPEADIAKVAIGNLAEITLDAYGNDFSWKAKVVKIDPAETVVDGISTYKTTLEFDKSDEKIRSGMTANTTITTTSEENVLSVPSRAIYEKDGKKFVRIFKGTNASEERAVTAGIRGSNGNIEILSGLSEGEFVITASKIK